MRIAGFGQEWRQEFLQLHERMAVSGKMRNQYPITFLDLTKHRSVSGRSCVDLHGSEVLSFVPTPSLAEPALQKFSVKFGEISAIDSESPALRLGCAHRLTCIDHERLVRSQFRRALKVRLERERLTTLGGGPAASESTSEAGFWVMAMSFLIVSLHFSLLRTSTTNDQRLSGHNPTNIFISLNCCRERRYRS